MKKIIVIGIALLALAGFLVIMFQPKSAIQKVTHASKKQSVQIEKVLYEQLSFQCESISEYDLNNSMIETMNERYEAFKISDAARQDYVLILLKKNKDVICVLDNNNKLVYGLIDGDMLPEYFKDFIY